jgi:hypothetical protein
MYSKVIVPHIVWAVQLARLTTYRELSVKSDASQTIVCQKIESNASGITLSRPDRYASDLAVAEPLQGKKQVRATDKHLQPKPSPRTGIASPQAPLPRDCLQETIPTTLLLFPRFLPPCGLSGQAPRRVIDPPAHVSPCAPHIRIAPSRILRGLLCEDGGRSGRTRAVVRVLAQITL